MNPTFQILSLSPQDWQRYKALRVRALAEEPPTFDSRLDQTLTASAETWIQRLKDSQEGERCWYLFAESQEELVGMVGAYLTGESSAHLISLFVVPEKRQQGVATALLQALLTLLEEQNFLDEVTLDVNQAQGAAVRLYTKFGFRIAENTATFEAGYDAVGIVRMTKFLY